MKFRKGSLAWFAFKYGRAIITLFFIFLLIVFLTAINTKETSSYAEEKTKVEQVVGKKEKAVKNDFQAFDIPLDEKLQKHICDVSEEYRLEPELVFAVIGQESNYRHCLIADGGDSKGLMQVQEQWHSERMERLGVSDLLNPYENVKVGVDYLAECIAKGGLEWGLMAYNGGETYANEMTKRGVITEYAESVLYLSENLGGEI